LRARPSPLEKGWDEAFATNYTNWLIAKANNFSCHELHEFSRIEMQKTYRARWSVNRQIFWFSIFVLIKPVITFLIDIKRFS